MDLANQERIEKYLRGELSETERLQFQQHLAKNKKLAKAFAVEQEMYNAIHLNTETDFRSRLEKITQPSEAPPKVIPLYRRPWVLAASLLFLIGLFWWLSSNNSGITNPQKLYADYYEQPAFSFNRGGENDNPDFQNVLNAYQKKEYQQVINSLTTIVSNNRDPKWQLMLGICYMETQQYQKAITIFDALQDNGQLPDDAVWYKGLTLLKTNQKDLAKNTFQSLLENKFQVTPKRQEKVKAILDSL